ncbi:hypothetical protein JCM3770_002900 [Rhodotorula araucariae]
MTLDPRKPSVEAVTRACYARGLSSETWLALVAKAAEARELDTETLERESTEALLALLTPNSVLPPLILSYLEAALHPLAALVRPSFLANAACQSRPLSLSTIEPIFAAVLSALSGAAPPTAPAEPPAAAATALNALLPLVLARPSAAHSTARYLAHVLSHPARAAPRSGPGDAAAHAVKAQQKVEMLQHALEALDARRAAGTGLDELRTAMATALARLTRPRGRKRAAASRSLDGEALRDGALRAGADAVLLVSDFLGDPHRPTAALVAALASLIPYRLAQAPFRGSTQHEALAVLLFEVLGTAVRLVQGAKREDAVIEAWLFAKLPQALKELQMRPDVPALDDPLADALRAVRDGLASAKSEGGMDVENASFASFDSLVVALCQRGLLSRDVGASLAQHVDPSVLQSAIVADYSDRLTGAGQEDIKELLNELLQSYASQQAISTAFADDFAAKTSSNDLHGLAILCDTVLENTDALAVLLLHVEPRALLAPVRELLDSVDTSQDDSGDNPIERYGSLVLFLQLVVNRFKLHTNLAYHLGSATSFFTRWLPSCSAVFALSTMTDDERSTVSGWISALFGEGISDDLMHSTNPRTLLRVAPTILKQSLMARQAGVVDLDSLRDALSYFLQELLRFTLPGVLLWLIEDVERTPPSLQQSAMLDILQTLVLSPTLPACVTELVSPALASLLLDPSLHGLSSSILDRPKLLKLIAPFRPPPPALAWAARLPAEHSTPASQLHADLSLLCGDAIADAAPVPAPEGSVPPLARSLARARAAAPTDAAFLRETLLPALLAQPARDAAERAAAATLASFSPDASGRGAAGGRALLPVLVEAVVLPSLADWAARVLPAPGEAGERARVELVADAIAGAAVRLIAAGGDAESGAQAALQLLGEGVRRAQEAVRRKSDDAAEDNQWGEGGGTVLDVLVVRVLSWPAVVNASRALAALAEARDV